MSLNIANYAARINPSFIDNGAVKDITNQILNAEAKKTVDLDSLNLSKFKRADLGVDLYSSRTDAQKATQIALRNAGLDVNLNQNLIANVQYLNTQAAVSTHQNVAKQVEGKIALPTVEGAQQSLKEVFALPAAAQVIESQNTNKDKKGSNPFSYHQPAANKQDAESVDALNIFA